MSILTSSYPIDYAIEITPFIIIIIKIVHHRNARTRQFSARLYNENVRRYSQQLRFAVMIAPKRKIARCNAEHRSVRLWNIASRRHIVYCLAVRLAWKLRMDECISIHLPQRQALFVGCSFRWNRFSILHIAQPAPLRHLRARMTRVNRIDNYLIMSG